MDVPLQLRRNGLDPAEDLARARDGEGVVRVETSWGLPGYLVCRYEDVRRVLADPVRFSSALTPLRGAGALDPGELARMRAGQLIGMDPPEHSRLRRMLTPEFTGPRMRRLEPRIVRTVHAALDDLERASRPADLVANFALPVPSLVICELLGVPETDRAEFQNRSTRLLSTALSAEELAAERREERAYLAGLVARAKAGPGEDLLGTLVREHGDDLGTDELIGVAGQVLLAGHETTSNMLALGALALLRHPGQLAMIREDPALIEPAIEELLRWLSIAQSPPPRITTTEVKIAGQVIPEGALVICSIPAANRDPAFTGDPDRLDVNRDAAGHVAFGHGVHHCLGAPLARLEMRIALPALFQRFPDLALAEPYEQVDFRVFSVVFGLNSLRVTW